MVPELFTRLRSLLGSADTDESGENRRAADDADGADDPDDAEGGRFAGSLLDLSVVVGHGGGNAEAEREVEAVAEEAERLSEARER